MPTFTDPARDASEAHEALRGLAHASRTFEDPGVRNELVTGSV